MKKAVYKKIDEKIEYFILHHDEFVDEEGNTHGAFDEIIEKFIPIMGTVYEEMTQEEIDALQQEEVQEPTLEERLEALEQATLEMILGGI